VTASVRAASNLRIAALRLDKARPVKVFLEGLGFVVKG
jgi:hypothetical protein